MFNKPDTLSEIPYNMVELVVQSGAFVHGHPVKLPNIAISTWMLT